VASSRPTGPALPAADLVIRRYLDEGAKISREIAARYSN